MGRRRVRSAAMAMICAWAVAACVPSGSTTIGGPGDVSFEIRQGGSVIEAGGGPVVLVLSHTGGTGSGGGFCPGSAGLAGSMTTGGGFVGDAGNFSIDLSYHRGSLGYCGPLTISLDAPDGTPLLDNAAATPDLGDIVNGPPPTVVAACGETPGVEVVVDGPAVGDPSIELHLDLVVCSSAVVGEFGQGF